MPNTNLYLTVFTSLFCFMCELLCIYKIRLWVTWVIYCEELRSVESEPWVDFWSVLWYFWGTRRKELEMVISFSLCHYWLFNNKTMPFFFSPFFIFSPNFPFVYLKKATAPATAGFSSDSSLQSGKVLSTQVFKMKCLGSINFQWLIPYPRDICCLPVFRKFLTSFKVHVYTVGFSEIVL